MTASNAVITSLAAIAFVLVFGTTGYHFVEGWPILDCFYMTVITLTTIGFGEIHPLTPPGRLFTIILVFMGMGVVGHTVVTGTRFVVEGEINKVITRRRSMKALQKIRDHYIVCGFGRMGSFISRQLHDRGISFVVVEQDPDTQERVQQLGYLMVPGDATEEQALNDAGIANARGLVSVLSSDASNVYVVLTGRELNADLDIVARAVSESATHKLRRAGADRVFSPYKIGGMRMVMGILKPEVIGFLEVAMDHRALDIDVEQIRVGEHSPYNGMKILETGIRREMNLIILAVKKQDGQMVFNPGPDTVIDGHDTLIAMGKREMLKALEKKASSEIGHRSA